MREEAEDAQPVVEGHEDDATPRQRTAVDRGPGSASRHEAAAFQPHHHWPRLVGRFGRGPDIERQAVLGLACCPGAVVPPVSMPAIRRLDRIVAETARYA